jgi:Domain of unknown function (DUF222)/HNH endonuclease
VVGELRSALDALAMDDVFLLSAPELLDSVRDLVAIKNRIEAELARRVRRMETSQAVEHDGLRSPASWLRGHTRLSGRAAAQLVATGRAVEQLPHVADRFAAGELTGEQVAVIARVVEPEQLAAAADQEVDLAGLDETLADLAATRPHHLVKQAVAHYLARLDPDGPEPDPTERRSLSYTKFDDGSVSGRFKLDPVGGEKFQAALESILNTDRPAGDQRTKAQRQGDAFVQLLDNALAQGNLPIHRGVKPQVLVILDAEDFTDPATGRAAASCGYGAQVSAATARRLACDGQVTRILLDPDGLPLDVGRSQRVVPPHIRRAVEIRDRHCVFAGCGAPTWWSEVHHLVEWVFGGETSLENSALLCERHHTKVHHGFRVERQPDGRWRTWRSDGTEILPHPTPVLA